MELCMTLSGYSVLVWKGTQVPIPPGTQFNNLFTTAGREIHNDVISMGNDEVDTYSTDYFLPRKEDSDEVKALLKVRCLCPLGYMLVWEDTGEPIPPGTIFREFKEGIVDQEPKATNAGRNMNNWAIYLSCNGVAVKPMHLVSGGQ